MKQVDKKAYEFKKYCGIDRWASYWYQLDEILKLKPTSVLEIGVGTNVFGSYLKRNTDIKYFSMDIADDLHPDIFGNIEKIPLENNSIDVVCVFEVLEHLPFEKFENVLKELKRVSKNYVVISLPHFGPMIKFSFKLPFLKEIKIAFKIPYYLEHKFNGQHYWGIGKKGYSSGMIKEVMNTVGYKIVKDFIPYENSYHHFYILDIPFFIILYFPKNIFKLLLFRQDCGVWTRKSQFQTVKSVSGEHWYPVRPVAFQVRVTPGVVRAYPHSPTSGR